MKAAHIDHKEIHAAMGAALHAFSGTDSTLALGASYLIPAHIDIAGIVIFTPKSIDARLEMFSNLLEVRYGLMRSDKPELDCAGWLLQSFEALADRIKRQRRIRNAIAHGRSVTIKSPSGKTSLRLMPSAFDYVEESRFRADVYKVQLPGMSAHDLVEAAKNIEAVNDSLLKLVMILQSAYQSDFIIHAHREAIRELATELRVPISPA